MGLFAARSARSAQESREFWSFVCAIMSRHVSVTVFGKSCWGPVKNKFYVASAERMNLSLYRMGWERLNPLFMQGAVVDILRDSGLMFEITSWGYIRFQSSPLASRLDDVLIPLVRYEFGVQALYYVLPNRWTWYECMVVL